jgi:hypothetical protein
MLVHIHSPVVYPDSHGHVEAAVALFRGGVNVWLAGRFVAAVAPGRWPAG